MEIILKTVIEQGVLIAIFLVFLKTYIEDRASNKDDRDRSNSLTQNLTDISKEMVKVVEENTTSNSTVIEALSYTKEAHEELDIDVKEIKADLREAITKIAQLEKTHNNSVLEKEVLPMLVEIDAKVARVGKSVDTERGDSHGYN